MTSDFRDRPSMLDRYGGRIPLYPADVRGAWRNRRTWTQIALMIIFLGLPWVSINHAPAVLLDLENGRFAFFGLKFMAHDTPLVFLVLGSFAIGLALVTALWGRVWCGWACPQTVFLDGVFRRIERWTEGSHLQRRLRDSGPLTLEKILRKNAKWLLFTLVSVILTHTFLAYFYGGPRVLEMMTTSPGENWAAFIFILFVNGLMLFDMAWFREQFCLIVCPYGRIQSVLMDRETVTVQYDADRGEPRMKKTAKAGEGGGHCIDCFKCVNACPTGIDIRNGIQLECIACTACMDACDDVMRKVGRPEGLIRYKASTSEPIRWMRPRVAIYALAMAILSIGLVLALTTHDPVQVALLRALGDPYLESVGADGQRMILNSYRLHVHNQGDSSLKLSIFLEPTLAGAALKLPDASLQVQASESKTVPFVIEVPLDSLRGKSTETLRIHIQNETHEVQFVAPRN